MPLCGAISKQARTLHPWMQCVRLLIRSIKMISPKYAVEQWASLSRAMNHVTGKNRRHTLSVPGLWGDCVPELYEEGRDVGGMRYHSLQSALTRA